MCSFVGLAAAATLITSSPHRSKSQYARIPACDLPIFRLSVCRVVPDQFESGPEILSDHLLLAREASATCIGAEFALP